MRIWNHWRRGLRLIRAALKLAVRNGIHSLIMIPLSAFSCMTLRKNKRSQYIVICDHIGDFVIAMGYLNAFRSHKNLEHISLCVTEKFVDLLDGYEPCWEDVIVLPPRKLYRMLELGSTDFGLHIAEKMPWLTLINPADAFIGDRFGTAVYYPQIAFADCIRYGCMKLPERPKFVPPYLGRTEIFWPDGFQPGRTVLLCPDARFMCGPEREFWEETAVFLSENGYFVCTNLSFASQQAIAGTVGIYYSLREIAAFVRAGGYAVGVRSGLMDLLMYIPCSLAVFYEKDDLYRRFFRLEALPESRARNREFLASETIRNQAEELLCFMGGEICL